MNPEKEHILPWLGAYLDGELTSEQRAQADAHLAGCTACQGELEGWIALSNLLRAAPAPASPVSDADFAAGVIARLPKREPFQSVGKPAVRFFHLAWKFAPLGLFAAWAFIQAVAQVSGGLLLAVELSPAGAQAMQILLPYAAGEDIPFSLLQMDLLQSLLGQAPVNLPAVDLISPLALVNLLVLLVLGALFLSWLASWWVYQTKGNIDGLRKDS